MLLVPNGFEFLFSDDERKAKEAALNELEAYIYKVKNRIIDDEDKLKLVSTDEQRQEVRGGDSLVRSAA